jgi:hypothetical protein
MRTVDGPQGFDVQESDSPQTDPYGTNWPAGENPPKRDSSPRVEGVFPGGDHAMTVSELLPLLNRVRQRGSRWSAQCPAHGDKSPSLSISEGERGILLRCFAGCSVREICNALGLEITDLFFDAATTHTRRPVPRPVKIDRVALAFRYELSALDLRLRADRIIETGKHLNMDTLNDAELDRAITIMSRAHADIGRAQLFENVADNLRMKNFMENRHGDQRVA